MSGQKYKDEFVIKQLIKLRESTGMNNSDFAKFVGCNKSTYGRWENGDNFPSSKNLAGIASATGVGMSYFEKGGLSPRESLIAKMKLFKMKHEARIAEELSELKEEDKAEITGRVSEWAERQRQIDINMKKTFTRK